MTFESECTPVQPLRAKPFSSLNSRTSGAQAAFRTGSSTRLPKGSRKLLEEYAERQQFRIVQTLEDVETARSPGRQQFGDTSGGSSATSGVASSWLALEELAMRSAEGRGNRYQRVFELVDKAQSSTDQANLLRMLGSNFTVADVSVTPAHRYPSDRIFQWAKLEEWSGREDSNLRPPGPEPGALPDCATPRTCADRSWPEVPRCAGPPGNAQPSLRL